MARVPMAEGRERLGEIVELSQREAVFLERYGRPTAVVLSAERYDELMSAIEELEDAEAFDTAMADEVARVPWETVKADLGWP